MGFVRQRCISSASVEVNKAVEGTRSWGLTSLMRPDLIF